MKFSKQRALHGAALITDPRFARLHSDPRFQRAAKRKLRIPIDSRFRHMFSDTRFADPLSLDKRGRPIKKRKQRHALRQYYHVDEGLDAAVQDERLDETELVLAANKSTDHEQDDGSISQEQGGSVSRTKSKKGDHSPSCTNTDPNLTELGDVTETVTAPESDHRLNQALIPKKSKNNRGGVELDGIGGSARVEDEKQSFTEHSDLCEDSDGSDTSRESSETASTSSSSEESSSEEEDEELDASMEETEESKIAVTDQETRRLALVNMDWDHIRAVDILVVMNSFLPKGGQILSVSVYPSEFGLQQLKEEEKQGPKGLFEPQGYEEDEEEAVDGINMEKLRQYEMAKLRYFYAVIECDSCATSDFLYKSCDGMEFERTSNILDLRFIPDDMKFELNPRDVATEVPYDYQSPMFETRALQHSTVKLTWDDDEPARAKTLYQNFNAEQLNEMDFNVYLASDNSDVGEADDSDREEKFDNMKSYLKEDEKTSEDVNETRSGNINSKERLRNKYRALLLGSDNPADSKDPGNVNEDMEITFHTGLDELSKRLMNRNKQQDEETIWETYLRKKKENKKARKNLRLVEEDEQESTDEQRSDDPFFARDGLDFEDPFFKSADEVQLDDNLKPEMIDSEISEHIKTTLKSRKGQRAEAEKQKLENEKNKAELELLLADERFADNSIKGYNLKKRLMGKGRKMDTLPNKLPTVDYDDLRFSALFTSHQFAIDPTEAEYRRSAAQLRPLLEKQQKQLSQVDQDVADPSKVNSQSIDEFRVETSKKTKNHLSLMVRSLKRKVGAYS